MFKYVPVEFVAYFVEVIHVELSDEGGEISVSKVDGEDLLLEFFDVQNGEADALVIPAHNVRVLTALSQSKSTSRIS